MFGSVRRLFKSFVLLEAGASIIFFGLLMHNAQLERCATTALEELRDRGYKTPSGSDPVRVYPGCAPDELNASQAGGWRPGTISLRQDPIGSAGPEVYLRHELMHEASFRTCEGKLPLWAEEAAAIDFSGELSGLQALKQPADAEIEHLRDRVRIGAPQDSRSYQTMKDLISLYGWPRDPCAISARIEKLVTPRVARSETGFSYILINLMSGLVLESKGDLYGRYPPGSLLKVPYAASLRGAQGENLSEELATSDTARLCARKGSLDPERLRLLLGAAGDSVLSRSVQAERWPSQNERLIRELLGERSQDSSFPFEAKLGELALVLRASLLLEPDYFPGLSRNGFAAGTTLYSEPDEYKEILRKLDAVCKTGTVSDSRGNPIVGHLMAAWPAQSPVLLAVFRTTAGSGASNLKRASKILKRWSVRFPAEYAKVRVSVMTLTPRKTWDIFNDCPSFDLMDPRGWKKRVSTCGHFRIISSAPGSRTERTVSGVLTTSPDGLNAILETDSETYADSVINSEAQALRGEAAKALRAVVVWNGVHGGSRHPGTSSVCDSTHCMVFQGSPCEKSKPGRKTSTALLRLLDENARKKGLDWLHFSRGGQEQWEMRMSSLQLRGLADESAILDIRRERTRTGTVSVHLLYKEGEENVPCEFFRNRLKLPSCPDSINYDENSAEWIFRGMGKGHGLGLSVERSETLANSGLSAQQILDDAYRFGLALP